MLTRYGGVWDFMSNSFSSTRCDGRNCFRLLNVHTCKRALAPSILASRLMCCRTCMFRDGEKHASGKTHTIRKTQVHNKKNRSTRRIRGGPVRASLDNNPTECPSNREERIRGCTPLPRRHAPFAARPRYKDNLSSFFG